MVAVTKSILRRVSLVQPEDLKETDEPGDFEEADEPGDFEDAAESDVLSWRTADGHTLVFSYKGHVATLEPAWGVGHDYNYLFTADAGSSFEHRQYINANFSQTVRIWTDRIDGLISQWGVVMGSDWLDGLERIE